MVFSEADATRRTFVPAMKRLPIGPSYLNIDRIIGAAQKAAVDAIHPGYGFLSENADFADACDRAGIVFIGPAPDVIRMMGLKTGGRDVAASAGVPVVPAYDAASHDIQFPVLIKASAGGGGRGMRIVRQRAELAEALESAGREAERAFGDGSLLMERYIEEARHIEFQIFGDHARQRDPVVRARVFHPAPASKDHRGNSIASSLRRSPPAHGRRCRSYRPRHELHQRRNRGVSAGAVGRILFHRSEHAHPGGASGHGVGDGPRSGALADRCGRRQAPAAKSTRARSCYRGAAVCRRSK